MTAALSPLALPGSDWETWTATHCDDELARARALADELRSAVPDAALRLWNDVNVALVNVFCLGSLMANVHPDEAVRTRAEQAEQDAQKLETELSLDRDVYDALCAVDPVTLDDEARRVLAHSLRDFRRAGVDQSEEVRDRVRALAEREMLVGQEFDKGIRDGVRSTKVAPSVLDGLPEDYVEAHPPGDDGLVVVTTDYPDYVPFMTFCRDRDSRRALAHEFLNRAWPENDARLRELLALRREHATILGYPDWPSYDAEVKMIGKGAAIPEFVERITEAAAAAGRRDLGVLVQRLQQDHVEVTTLDAVDRSFYAEAVRREQFDVDAQQIRTYFDFTKVRAGLLEVTGRLFDVEYVDVPDGTRWHEDVTVHDVVRDGERLGRIYLDLHPRAGKFSHAAMFPTVQGIAGRQLPEGTLVCNFSRQLMEHDHVVTLFHEFGHLVHQVLAGGHEWARFSGVSTEWDFVEAPSQMLEEWAWDADILTSFATNPAGEPIPRAMVERMRAADEFGKGLQARTQMFYAALAYRLHMDVPDDVTATLRELQERFDLCTYVADTHFHAAFGHLNGYGSGYYTYMWSQVIAKDMFSAFDTENMFDPAVAHRYRDRVLAPGGSKDAADLVADFLDRPYEYDAFEAWLNR